MQALRHTHAPEFTHALLNPSCRNLLPDKCAQLHQQSAMHSHAEQHLLILTHGCPQPCTPSLIDALLFYTHDCFNGCLPSYTRAAAPYAHALTSMTRVCVCVCVRAPTSSLQPPCTRDPVRHNVSPLQIWLFSLMWLLHDTLMGQVKVNTK